MTDHDQPSANAEPTPSRPHIPGYGVPEGASDLLPWSHVAERLAVAKNYWVVTVGGDGMPHAVPVWAVWVEGALYFGAGPRSARNLGANPRVAVHLENGEDVVILEGATEVVTNPTTELSAAIDDAFAAKYDWRPSTDGTTPGEGSYLLRPTVAYAWTSFPADATRWRW